MKINEEIMFNDKQAINKINFDQQVEMKILENRNEIASKKKNRRIDYFTLDLFRANHSSINDDEFKVKFISFGLGNFKLSSSSKIRWISIIHFKLHIKIIFACELATII